MIKRTLFSGLMPLTEMVIRSRVWLGRVCVWLEVKEIKEFDFGYVEPESK